MTRGYFNNSGAVRLQLRPQVYPSNHKSFSRLLMELFTSSLGFILLTNVLLNKKEGNKKKKKKKNWPVLKKKKPTSQSWGCNNIFVIKRLEKCFGYKKKKKKSIPLFPVFTLN